MAEVKLTSVNFSIPSVPTDYIISTVLDCKYGHEGVKLISNISDFSRYYGGVSQQLGYTELIKNGATLLVKRLNKVGTSKSTLRLLNNSLKYTYPTNYESIDPTKRYEIAISGQSTPMVYEPEKVSYNSISAYNDFLQEKGVGDSVQKLRTHTYNYVLDFNKARIEDEDWLAIPSYVYDANEGEASELDLAKLFYFVDVNQPTVKQPDEIEGSLKPENFGGGAPVAIDINTPNETIVHALFEWYTGITDSTIINNNYAFTTNKPTEVWSGSKLPDEEYYNYVNYLKTLVPGDSNIIPELCKIVDNKLILVFREPVSNVSYFKSKNIYGFNVYSDSKLDYELLTEATLGDSVISFESLVEGDFELDVRLEYVKEYEFYMYFNHEGEEQSFYVSLDRDAKNFNGASIFVEDVLNKEYDLISCRVNLGGQIASGSFTPSDAQSIEGSYLVAKGNDGSSLPYANENWEYRDPLFDSIDELVDSDIDANLFLFDGFNRLRHQNYIVDNYLDPLNMIGFVNIPDHIIFNESDKEAALIRRLLPENKRMNILYTFGKSIWKSRVINNSFYYALNAINADYHNTIKDNKFISVLKQSDKDLLDKYKINYIESNINGFYIDFIQNYPQYLEPAYALVANYVHVSVKRYLRTNLGIFPKDLLRGINTRLFNIKSHSNLITDLSVSEFKVETNTVTTILNLEVSGLLNRIIELKIKINN